MLLRRCTGDMGLKYMKRDGGMEAPSNGIVLTGNITKSDQFTDNDGWTNRIKHIHTHAHTYTYIHIRTYIRRSRYIYTCTHTQTHTHINIFTHRIICTNRQTQIHAACTYIFGWGERLATGWTVRGSNPSRGRPALGPIQRPTQWVPGYCRG